MLYWNINMAKGDFIKTRSTSIRYSSQDSRSVIWKRFRISPDDVVACCKDICNYIYDTYGRFPAHVDAMYVPGVWVQAHHLDLKYYDTFYSKGYSSTQADHQSKWHGGEQ